MDAEDKLWDDILNSVKKLVDETEYIIVENIATQLRERDIAFVAVGGHISIFPCSYKASATAHAESKDSQSNFTPEQGKKLVDWWLKLPTISTSDGMVRYHGGKKNISYPLAHPQALDFLPAALDEVEYLKDHLPPVPEDVADAVADLQAGMPESVNPSL